MQRTVRTRIRLGFTTLLLLLSGCFFVSGSSQASAICGATATSPYVTSDGSSFCWQGQELRLFGATMYRGHSWQKSDFTGYIDQIIASAEEAHLNTIAATQFLDAATPDWRDPTIWANMDYLMQQAAQHHLFVIIHFAAYRSYLEAQNIAPYDPANWTDFLQFVGSRYRDATALAYYSLSAEAASPLSQNPFRVSGDQLLTFFRQASDTLYAADGGHHLISTGGFGSLSQNLGVPWQAIFSLPHINVTATHAYSAAERAFVATVAQWSNQHGKPYVLEEFGFQQGDGDAQRAQEFTTVFQLCHQAGVAGTIFWNLGPEDAPQSFDVNDQTPLTLQAIQAAASA
jgi:hypothetical protein